MGESQARPDPNVVGGSIALVSEIATTTGPSLSHHWKRQVDAVCERFEDAWDRDSTPRVEDYVEDAAIPFSRRAALLAELLKIERELREKRGDHPSAGEYLSRFSAYPLVVRSVFGEDRIGDYDLIAPIGEGGMGIVYHARHRKIGREVALKMIRPFYIEDASTVDRFHLEAQLAARLEHENIVTVYEAGLADGQHYYTMRYIAGQSLSEMIAKVPMDANRAAGILEQVARAVDFAHTHDVLHRDIKPRNILIDPTGRAYVTDFGLAKALGRAGTGATRTDDRLGTPPYMSPEQVRDPARAGIASDIYSLGATLFECLTGRAPFQGNNPIEVYRQILDVEPPTPRSLNPRCPRDLETICLKCLDKDPGHRYATAFAMAEDLRRYRNQLPILARRVGPIERLGKWGRKHPTTAALIAVSLISGILVAAIVQTRRTNAIIERSYVRARATVDAITQFGERRLSDQPDLQKELLEIALQYYNEFLDQRGHDPAIAENLAETFTRVARLYNELNSGAQALKAHQGALGIRRDLVKRSPAVRRHQAALAETLHDIGILERATGRRDRSIEAFREALEIRTALVQADPTCRTFLSASDDRPISARDRALIGDLARSHGYIGDWERESGMKDAAQRSYDQAQVLRARLASSDPSDLIAKFQLARSENNSGILFKEDGKLEQALAAHTRAWKLQSDLVNVGEKNATDSLEAAFRASGKTPDMEFDDFRTDLATTLNYIGILHELRNEHDKAITAHLEAAKLLNELAAEHPGVPRWDNERALTATYLGELRHSPEDVKLGRELFDRLLKVEPDAPRSRSGLARNLYADGLLRGGSEGGKLLSRALRAQRQLLDEQPDNQDFQMDLARTQKAIDSRLKVEPGLESKVP